MSLPHAILGLLQREPMTGYDLKTRAFDTSIAHFWPADQAQIYRTLDKMTEEGWVESRVEIQQERPNRKVYSITDAGRIELRRWLETPQPLPVYREAFLIQVFFANSLPNEKITALLEQYLEAHQARLAHYQQIPLPPLEQLMGNRERALQRLTLELGIQIEQAHIHWLQMSLAVVRDLKDNR